MSTPAPMPVVGATWVDRDKRCRGGNRRVEVTAVAMNDDPLRDRVWYFDGIGHYSSRLERFQRRFRPVELG